MLAFFICTTSKVKQVKYTKNRKFRTEIHKHDNVFV